MSIKESLREALKATIRANAAFIGKQSTPSSDRISYTPTVTTPSRDQWGKIVAPFDGYLFVFVDNPSGTDYIDLRNETAKMYNAIAPTWGKVGGIAVPAKKGDTLQYHVNSKTEQYSGITVSFIKLTGGGKNPYKSTTYEGSGVSLCSIKTLSETSLTPRHEKLSRKTQATGFNLTPKQIRIQRGFRQAMATSRLVVKEITLLPKSLADGCASARLRQGILTLSLIHI